MKSVILGMVLFFTQSCSWAESDYDKLMNPIKKIKLAEKASGKTTPTFDGVVEPDFPDEKENNKTLEGVDSNKDGVRDDIEIWINRTAEDEYVRGALKEAYKKDIEFYKSLHDGDPEPQVHSKLSNSTAIWGCVSIVSIPYDKTYLEKHKRNAGMYYTDVMVDVLYANTALRSEQLSKWNKFHFEGTIGGDSSVECVKYPFGKKYLELKESFKNNKFNK